MADENENKVYYWIVIDDDKTVLKNIATELRNEGEMNIFSLKPSGRKKNELSFKIPLPAEDRATVWSDYDYKVIPYDSTEREETTLYELLKKISDETTQEKQPYFIFLIDLLFEKYNFCGFDLFKFVRCTIDPKRYVVKFLSHLSRKMVSEFLRAEFPDLKLGQEVSRPTGKRFVGDVADDGFFSKAPYRITGMTILSKHRIEYLKAIFPRSVTEYEAFALYVIYPYEPDFENSKSKIDLNKTTKTVFSPSFYVNKKTKKTYIKRAFYDNRQTILKNAQINNSSDSTDEMIGNKDYDEETPKYSKFTKKRNIIFRDKKNDNWSSECSSLREPFPLYRHELKRWYRWTNPAYEIVDAFYIYNTRPKPKVTVKCNGYKLHVEMIPTPITEDDLLKEVELHRPRYILIELPKDDNFNIIYSVCKITECISYFEIHGFAVIFVAGDVENNKLSGIREIAPNILIAKKNDTIEFEEMSPIYWHLIEKSYFQGGTFIEHELSHLSSCPLGNREEKLKKIIRLAEAHDALAHTHYTPKIEALLAGEGGKIDKEDDKWYIMENNTSKEIDINAYLYEKKYKVSLKITIPNDTEEKGVKDSLEAIIKDVAERPDSQFALVDDDDTGKDGSIILFVCNSMEELTTINADVKHKKAEEKSKGKAVVFYVLHRYGKDFLSSMKPKDENDKNDENDKRDKGDKRDGSVQNLRDNIGSDHWLLTYEESSKDGEISYNMELDSCYFIFQGLLKKIEEAKIEEAEKIKEIPNITIANWLKTRDVDINKSELKENDSLLCQWDGKHLREFDNTNFLKDRLHLLSKSKDLLSENKEQYKRYQFKCSKGKIIYNDLFPHEQRFVLDKLVGQSMKTVVTRSPIIQNQDYTIKEILEKKGEETLAEEWKQGPESYYDFLKVLAEKKLINKPQFIEDVFEKNGYSFVIV